MYGNVVLYCRAVAVYTHCSVSVIAKLSLHCVVVVSRLLYKSRRCQNWRKSSNIKLYQIEGRPSEKRGGNDYRSVMEYTATHTAASFLLLLLEKNEGLRSYRHLYCIVWTLSTMTICDVTK